MLYKLKETSNSKDSWVDVNHQSWPYISNDQMDHIYPNGGYRIIGDVGSRKESQFTLQYHDQCIDVAPYIPKLRSNEYCLGYIAVESNDFSDAYIRIIKRSNKKFLFLLLMLLLIGTGLFVGRDIWKQDEPSLDDSAISYHIEGLENKDPKNISIPLFGTIHVDSKTMKSTINLANPKGNPCYLGYRIILKERNEEIYRSKLIEPGTAIPGFKVNRKLEKGSYPSLIIVETYSLQDHSVKMNGGEMDVTLVVEEE